MKGKDSNALSAAARQAKRTAKIKAAELVQRKVIAHPDDFKEINALAKKLYEKRGIKFN